MDGVGDGQLKYWKLRKHVADRISGLPDSIIHHIFSFIPSHYLVRSSVLSKRWRNLWRSHPSLRFDLRLFPHVPIQETPITEETEQTEHIFDVAVRFLRFITCFLSRRDPSVHIHKFSLAWNIDTPIDPHTLSNWITIALRYHVQILHVEFRSPERFHLPCSLLTSASLTRLSLDFHHSYLRFATSTRTMSLPSLKHICLSSLGFQQENVPSLEAFLSSCPKLETLIFQQCFFVGRLDITINAPHQLKKLIIDNGFSPSNVSIHPSTIRVSAPGVVQFKLKVDLSGTPDWYFLDLPSLVDAFIAADYDYQPLYLVKILSGLHNAQTLELNLCCLWNLSEQEMLLKESSLSFPKLKHMMLYEWTAPSIAILLDRSPNIESLTIVFEAGKFETILGCSSILHHLKLVEIEEYEGHEDQVEFLRSLLEKAVVLEKLIIYQFDFEHKRGLLQKQLIRELLKFPKASSKVQIICESRSMTCVSYLSEVNS